ncbi:MAG TPA: NAD+ kinase [Methylomirabilota bacterium]|nr:NAD+ kinase [Methylomirabilota bacterium]
MTTLEKVVVVTRKTRLVELIERFNTRAQAKFYIEHAGGDFGEYEREDAAYRRALDRVRRAVEVGLKIQVLDRELVSTYTFLPSDAVVTLGQDGLVANTAKYAAGQPIIGVNPDPERFDGVLLPFLPEEVGAALARVLHGRHRVRAVTLAEARLGDGQRLLAFNELFVGARTHVSARYRLRWKSRHEPQSSSGVLVATGAGSTGWLSSVYQMVSAVATFTGGTPGPPLRLEWEDRRLVFVVREPFVSRHSQASIVTDVIAPGERLVLESAMPAGGAIFSDGIEADYLAFDSGTTASIGAARELANLVVP